jgi:hypothetical protein
VKSHADAEVFGLHGVIAHRRPAGLRQAIQNGEVSFPAQVPSFPRQHSGEIQWRVVTLYFVRGWTCDQLAARYGITSRRVRQLLRLWVDCATVLGYLQEIPAESSMAPRSEEAAAA